MYVLSEASPTEVDNNYYILYFLLKVDMKHTDS